MAAADDDDSRSRIEDTSEDSDSMDSESDHYGEHFLVVLRNLISGGQLLLHGGDDDDNYDSLVRTRPPKIKAKPLTKILDKSEYSQVTKQACGLLDLTNRNRNVNNVTSLLTKRERGLFQGSKFSRGVKSKIANCYIPSEMCGGIDHNPGKVFCGIFSKDGNTFLTAAQGYHISDRQLRLFNSRDNSYEMFHMITARDVGWSVLDVAFSPNAQFFVYSTWSSSLHLCNTFDKREQPEPLVIANTSRRFCLFSVEFSNDGKQLICGANDGCLYVYDIERRRRTFKISSHESDLNRVTYADEASHIIYTGGDDGLVKIWDTRTLDERDTKPVGILAGHQDGVTYIDSRGDGRHLISNSKDQSIKLWDIRCLSNDATVREALKVVRDQPWDYRWQGVPRHMYDYKKLEGDTSIMTYKGHVVSKTLIRAKFSPAATTGQRYIYSGCGFGRLMIYDSLTGKIVKQRKGHMSCVRDVAWHPTRNEILTSSWDGMVGKWTYCKKNPHYHDKQEDLGRMPLRRSARLAARQQEARDST
ncbi:unnamed protein product [Ceutorhynchus assimilis]|uniref:DDB1- and CUL4-associated factor 11 n=1 Tax=Ceutorhynchus assimilis TaxID=467358 RepID=A0A9N9MXG6_9CUCU|nr:unnamed protein product [Ceutorhynchus assimilis]